MRKTDIATVAARNGYDAVETALTVVTTDPDISNPGIRFPDWTNVPEERPPTVSINGVGLCGPGELLVFTAGVSHGKSTVVGEAIPAAFLCNLLKLEECDSLGIDLQEVRSLSYIDMEQAWTRHHRMFRNMCRRAGLSPNDRLPGKDVFRYMTWRGIRTPAERQEALFRHIAHFKPGLILIDGLAHFVGSVNDEEQASVLLTQLLAVADTYDVSVIATIHQNNRDDSGLGRGHIGAEAYRLCDSMLFIEWDRQVDVRTITARNRFGKVRSGSVRDVHTSFAWNDGARMMLSCDTPEPIRGGEMKLRELFIGIFTGIDRRSHADLCRAITATTGASSSTAKSRIASGLRAKIIYKDSEGRYALGLDINPF